MPVTAKLSRRFYEQFGDEITNELVDWMNSVDATYQTSLRELNEINFARFDAKLEQRMDALESRMDVFEARIDGQLDGRIGSLRGEMDRRFAEHREALAAAMADLRKELVTAIAGQRKELLDALADQRVGLVTVMATSESRVIRWMVALWSSTILALLGLAVAVLRSA